MFIPSKSPNRHLHQVNFRCSNYLGKKSKKTVYQMGLSKQYLTLITTQLTATKSHRLFTVRPGGSREPPIIYSEVKTNWNIENGEQKSSQIKYVYKTSYIQQFLSTSQSEDGAHRKLDHLVLWIWQHDGARKTARKYSFRKKASPLLET